ncbi:hypothetical protein I552_0361 [Mycobacterium xenopi 3993]|nr:hypothetical protein I552_0361 [Mycobacterium xenopi 3993]
MAGRGGAGLLMLLDSCCGPTWFHAGRGRMTRLVRRWNVVVPLLALVALALTWAA